MNREETSLHGGWFSTSDMKLAVSLHAAGFAFKRDSECTRLKRNGVDSFTWHFETTTIDGEPIADFLRAWENPIGESVPRPSNMVCFLLAREAMFHRTHIISESHKVPSQMLLNRGDKRLMVTPRLGREERQKLAEFAS
jgi:hypothetical protein